ncbi:MAG: efflux RND transporter periplasmic adaptor subunit [Patescibacteria group bacterium]
MLIIKAVLLIRGTGPRLITWTSQLGWMKVAAGIVALAVVIGGVAYVANRSQSEVSPEVQIRSVEVKSVAELSSAATPLSLVGSVTSQSEATVRAEKSGQVVRVNTSLGARISAGAVAAEIENASERAAVLQAEGGLDAAQANLAKVTGGVRTEQRSILEANVTAATAALESARSNALSALLSAYATMDSGILATTDKLFTNPGSTNSRFNITTSDARLTIEIESTRDVLSAYLAREAAVSDSLSASSNLAAEIATMQTEVRAARSFLDLIVSALNKAIPSPSASSAAIATYLAEATAVRTSLTSTLTALAAATQSLSSSQTALEVARTNLEQGVTGGQPEDVAAAKAAVKQAQGGLAAARANLEKSIIRAPISGTVNSFSLKRGDYVQMTSPVLTIANNGALEILTYVSENDAREIAVGQPVTIEKASGVVTRIAPALDPLTKKIEVRIGVNDPKGLINGQSVLVSIVRTRAVSGGTDRITIPIAAVKVEAERTIVFTVDTGTLVAHEVELGTLLGERVVISSGLTPDMRIVVDARGLREGEKVEVN